MTTLTELAVEVLKTADGREKTAKSRAAAKLWFQSVEAGAPLPIGSAAPPDMPARPAEPELLPPNKVPRRRPGSEAGRIALIHSIAHIELNAVDLHWDIIPRFADVTMPLGYYNDWVQAADEESKHFNLLCDQLEAMGSYYGALPAHAGMFRAAQETAEDMLGRLAIVPMVLEARGLDVTPGMITLFESQGQEEIVNALKIIYSEEVGHVAYGSKWFHFLCGRHEHDPKDTFHGLVRKYFPGGPKPPFNEEKRAEAGLPLDFYWPLAEEAGAERPSPV